MAQMVVDGPSPLAVRLDELHPATHSHVVAFKSWTISNDDDDCFYYFKK